MSKEREYTFKVKTIESGQRQKYGDSYYHYQITSDCPEIIVKQFCMNVLRKSYKRENMPNPFAGQLREFKVTTNKNEGKSFLDKREEETYSYKTEELSTC